MRGGGTNQRLAKLKEYAKAMMNRYLVCLQKQATVRKLLFAVSPTASVLDHWDHAYYWMKISLFEDFVVSVCALILDEDRRTASYRALYEQVATAEVRVLLDREYRRPIKESPVLVGTVSPVIAEYMLRHSEKDRAAKRYGHFKALYARVCREGRSLIATKSVAPLRSIRDKVIAHLEMTYDPQMNARRARTLEDFPITWGEPFDFFKMAGSRVHDMYLLINDATYALEHWDEMCTEGADSLFDSIHPPQVPESDL